MLSRSGIMPTRVQKPAREKQGSTKRSTNRTYFIITLLLSPKSITRTTTRKMTPHFSLYIINSTRPFSPDHTPSGVSPLLLVLQEELPRLHTTTPMLLQNTDKHKNERTNQPTNASHYRLGGMQNIIHSHAQTTQGAAFQKHCYSLSVRDTMQALDDGNHGFIHHRERCFFLACLSNHPAAVHKPRTLETLHALQYIVKTIP
mmetsp:Transcript_10355/g.21759  ORF Transcript_10355/g.21759 Transcript_10355/m.21759 type:complete len:202 (-) Transcript_10355:184-789(-)